MKAAVIRPLLRKVDLDQDTLKNYRPVSNVTFIFKVLEDVVIAQLQKHLSINSSTETALMEVQNDLLHIERFIVQKQHF